MKTYKCPQSQVGPPAWLPLALGAKQVWRVGWVGRSRGGSGGSELGVHSRLERKRGVLREEAKSPG